MSAALTLPIFGNSGTPVAGLADITGWWLSGGVSSASCFGAYRGKGAATVNDSLVNLNNPGTRNLVVQGGVNWSSAGWNGMVNANYLRIDGGWYPTQTVTVIVQFVNAQEFSMQFCGASGGSGLREQGISINNVGTFQGIYNWGNVLVGGVMVSGNLAIAGKRFFRDGVFTDTISAGTGQNQYDWHWGSENWADTPHGGSADCVYVALACYDAVLTDEQVAAIAMQMAAF